MTQHLLIVEDDKGRREVVLDAAVYAIGRDMRCDIRLYSQFVSRRHATLVQLLKDDGSSYYRIVDGNLKGKTSANGLMINGRRLEAHDLQHEDEVVFGPQVRAICYCIGKTTITSLPLHPFPFAPIAKVETLMREDIHFYNQALHFAQKGKWSAAGELLLKAIDLKADVAEYHSLLAVSSLGQGLMSIARVSFRQAHQLNKYDPLLQSYLCFMDTGELGWWGDAPPNSGSPFPRNPSPLNPSTGAEASPDYGLEQTPQ